MTKPTKNSVKVSVKALNGDNQFLYFSIYEVRGKKANGEIVVSERYLRKKDAERHQALLYECKGLFETVYIMEEWVWVK